MASSPLNSLNNEARSEWVRLRTLINLRWLAVGGQTATVLVASGRLGIVMDTQLCVMAIGASVIFNIVSMIIYPENKRLSERETMLTLLFDLSQLVFLLYLTGGLNNPFALLILAPVTISATALRLQSTVFLGLMAIFMITVVMLFHVPLRTEDGQILRMPVLFEYGFWIALVIGVVFLAAYARQVALESSSMAQALLATQMALSREQKLTDLGGVVAAAAHELGTPLATIKLVSSELLDELGDDPDTRQDITLIRDQADRCRDILRDMGRTGKNDMHVRHAPISAVVREAAEPHEDRGKELHFKFAAKADSTARQPQIQRQPEIIHGLRNLIQNAVDFSRGNVWIDALWSDASIRIIVADDGRGYPPDLIGRIGDPFVRKRKTPAPSGQRPEYEGMGLGLFIAKTLLERSGAEIAVANCAYPFRSDAEVPARCGAIVEVLWPRQALEQPEGALYAPLGHNRPLEI